MAGVEDFKDLSDAVVDSGNRMRSSLSEAVGAAREMDRVLEAVSKQQTRSLRVSSSYDSSIKSTAVQLKQIKKGAAGVRDTIRAATAAFTSANKALKDFNKLTEDSVDELKEISKVDLSLSGLDSASKNMSAMAKAALELNKAQKGSVAISRQYESTTRDLSENLLKIVGSLKSAATNIRSFNRELKSGKKLGESFRDSLGNMNFEGKISFSVDDSSLASVQDVINNLQKELSADLSVDLGGGKKSKEEVLTEKHYKLDEAYAKRKLSKGESESIEVSQKILREQIRSRKSEGISATAAGKSLDAAKVPKLEGSDFSKPKGLSLDYSMFDKVIAQLTKNNRFTKTMGRDSSTTSKDIGAMADEALTKGSLYTHDAVLENLLKKQIDILNKQVDIEKSGPQNSASITRQIDLSAELAKFKKMLSSLDDLGAGVQTKVRQRIRRKKNSMSAEDAFSDVVPSLKGELDEAGKKSKGAATADLVPKEWDKEIKKINKGMLVLKNTMKNSSSWFEMEHAKEKLEELAVEAQNLRSFKEIVKDFDEAELAELRLAIATGKLNEKMVEIIGNKDEFSDVFNSQAEAAKAAAESDSSLEKEMNKKFSVMGKLNKKFEEGKEEAIKFTGGSTMAGGAMAAGGLAALFLAKELGELAEKYKEAAIGLSEFNVEMDAQSTKAFGSGATDTAFKKIRSELHLTKKEAGGFFDVLTEGYLGGVVSVQKLVAAGNQLKHTFGGDQTKRLKEYVELLKEIPTIETDLSISANSDDKTAALFALAQKGKISTVMELQAAGLAGGVKTMDRASKEDVKLLNAAHSTEKAVQDIKDAMLNKFFPTWGPQFAAITENTAEISKLLLKVVVLAGAMKAFGAMSKLGGISGIAGKMGMGAAAGGAPGAAGLAAGVSAKAFGALNVALGSFATTVALAGVAFGVAGHLVQKSADKSEEAGDTVAAEQKRFSAGILKTTATIATFAVIGSLVPVIGTVAGALAGLAVGIYQNEKNLSGLESDKVITGTLGKVNEILERGMMDRQSKQQTAALEFQKTFNRLNSETNNAKKELFEFRKGLAEVNLKSLAELGGTAAEFDQAFKTLTGSITGRFDLMKKAFDKSRFDILNNGKLDAQTRRMALDKLHKSELDSAREFVEGMKAAAESLYKSPELIKKQLQAKIAKATFDLNLEGRVFEASESGEMLMKEIHTAVSEQKKTVEQANKAVGIAAKTQIGMSQDKINTQGKMVKKFSSGNDDVSRGIRESVNINPEMVAAVEFDQSKMGDISSEAAEVITKNLVQSADGKIAIPKDIYNSLTDSAKEALGETADIITSRYNIDFNQLQASLKKVSDELDSVQKESDDFAAKVSSTASTSLPGLIMAMKKNNSELRAYDEAIAKSEKTLSTETDTGKINAARRDIKEARENKQQLQEEQGKNQDILNKKAGQLVETMKTKGGPNKDKVIEGFHAYIKSVQDGDSEKEVLNEKELSRLFQVKDGLTGMAGQDFQNLQKMMENDSKQDALLKQKEALSSLNVDTSESINMIQEEELRRIDETAKTEMAVRESIRKMAQMLSVELDDRSRELELLNIRSSVDAAIGDSVENQVAKMSKQVEVYEERLSLNKELNGKIQEELVNWNQQKGDLEKAIEKAEESGDTDALKKFKGDLSYVKGRIKVANEELKSVEGLANEMGQKILEAASSFQDVFSSLSEDVKFKAVSKKMDLSSAMNELANYSDSWKSMTKESFEISLKASQERLKMEKEAIKSTLPEKMKSINDYYDSLLKKGEDPNKVEAGRQSSINSLQVGVLEELAKKEVEQKRSVVEAAKKEMDLADAHIEARQQVVEAEASFLADIGGSWKQVLDLQYQSVAYEKEKADIAAEYTRKLEASGERGLVLDQARSAARLAELKYQQKALGAQRNAYEKLAGMAFGSIRDSYGIRSNTNSPTFMMGRENTQVKTRSGMYRSAGKEGVLSIEQRSANAQLAGFGTPAGAKKPTDEVLDKSMSELTQSMAQKSDIEKQVAFAMNSAKSNEETSKATQELVGYASDTVDAITELAGYLTKSGSGQGIRKQEKEQTLSLKKVAINEKKVLSKEELQKKEDDKIAKEFSNPFVGNYAVSGQKTDDYQAQLDESPGEKWNREHGMNTGVSTETAGVGAQKETVFQRSAGGLETAPGQSVGFAGMGGESSSAGGVAKVTGEITVKFDNKLFKAQVAQIVGEVIRTADIRKALTQQGFTNRMNGA